MGARAASLTYLKSVHLKPNHLKSPTEMPHLLDGPLPPSGLNSDVIPHFEVIFMPLLDQTKLFVHGRLDSQVSKLELDPSDVNTLGKFTDRSQEVVKVLTVEPAPLTDESNLRQMISKDLNVKRESSRANKI